MITTELLILAKSIGNGTVGETHALCNTTTSYLTSRIISGVIAYNIT